MSSNKLAKVITVLAQEVISFTTELVGYHSGQSDLLIKAIIKDKVVGFLSYTLYKGIAYINMIKVEEEYRRQGIGLGLVTELKKNVAEDADIDSIDISGDYATKEGQALLDKAQLLSKK